VANQQRAVHRLGKVVPEAERLGKVMPGVDVQERKRYTRGGEGFACEPRGDDRVLAAGEEQCRTFELRGHFAQNQDPFTFELRQMAAAGDALA
jgi:hypothetical protein